MSKPPSPIRRWVTAHLPSIVLFLGLLGLWQVASTSFGIREYILPSPASVAPSSSVWTAMPPSTHQYGTGQASDLALPDRLLVAGVR